MRFDQCGAVARLIQLSWMQFKRRQRFRANAAEPEAAEMRLDEYENICYALSSQ